MAPSKKRLRPLSNVVPGPTCTVNKRFKTAQIDNFSPKFWDNLSAIYLTARSLRELDRRQSFQRVKLSVTNPTYLRRFASQGGPDLRHLCGYKMPASRSDSMTSSRPSCCPVARARSTNWIRKSSAYDHHFEQHLADHKIYMPDHDHGDDLLAPEPEDVEDIRQALSRRRASLSPSRLTKSAFQDFKKKNTRASLESDIVADVVPIIYGFKNIPSQQNVLFTAMAHLTDEKTARPTPDMFDGARLGDLDPTLRRDEELRSMIIPTKHAKIPVVPNFFSEFKGPAGTGVIALRQACYDGSYGARAMHALQNYGKSEPTFDGKAYSYSSTYCDGQLKLFAHHQTMPSVSGDQPQYHMTQLRSYSLTDSHTTYVEGVSALRNLRERAQDCRRTAINAANIRVSRSNMADEKSANVTELAHSAKTEPQ